MRITSSSGFSFRHAFYTVPSRFIGHRPHLRVLTRFTAVHVGDFGYVVYRGVAVAVIVADTRPFGKLGEGSIALHRALGRELCATRVQTEACTLMIDEVESIDRDIITVLFPGTARHHLTPVTLAATIKREVNRLRATREHRRGWRSPIRADAR